MSILSSLARASKALTIGASVPTANDTVAIGGKTYTWKASTTTGDGEVKIGGTIGASGDNLAAAINAGAGGGSVYGSLTPANAYVTASSDGAGVVTVTARTPGAGGNFIAIAESGTNTVWAGGATVLSGGSGSSGTAIAQTAAELQAILDRTQSNAQVISEVTAMKAELVASGAS